jgi:iron complex outermembrane receptor protein
MKKLHTLVTAWLLVTMPAFVFSQSTTGSVHGTIADAGGKGIEAATVTLLRAADSGMVKVAVSDKAGLFEFERIATGRYFISITAVGYNKKLSQLVTVDGSSLSLPVIQLQPSGKSLGEVTVVAKRPLIENKIDRMVVNVEAAPTNAGATAMEVLEKSPGITVNNDGAISLKGKQGVIVMMDGKPTYLSPADLANVLKNMPASALDQIEIMTNPPAKYDASGNSGIINIKTKKSRSDGFNGSFSQGGTLSWFKRGNAYYTPFKNTTSLNLNWRKGKVNLFGNFNYNYREGKGELEFTRKFYEKTGQLNSISESYTAFNFRNNNYTAKIGADLYADKKNVFGIVLNGFAFFGRPQPLSAQVIKSPDGTIESSLNSSTVNKLSFYNYSGNVNYKHSFDSAGRELTADLDYIGYSNGSKSVLVSDFYDGTGVKQGNLTLRGDIPGDINIYSVKADYVHPLKNNMRFDAGFKSSFVKNDNEVLYERASGSSWVKDARSNHFIYKENINAVYVSINKKWTKWSGQVGLRLENTTAKGNQVTNDSGFTRRYTNLFPTGYLNYDVSKSHALTLSYGRRIERPNYQDLNPFLWFLDSLTYRQGNPYLLPQFAHNIELRHTFKGKFTTTINFTSTDDVISQLLKQNTEKRTTFLTIDNVARFRNIGIAVNAPLQLAKWWSTNLFVNVFNNKYEGVYYNSYTLKNDPINVDYTSFLVNISNTFTFPKGWSGEISGFYRGKGVDQLSVAEPMYFMNIGAQKNILKGKGTLRMNLRDPFHWQQFRGNTVYSDIDMRVRNRWDNRNLTITISYRFGKSTVQQARRRASGTQEEQNRAGGGGNQ